jgi:acyl-coenzyme A thioesterase PaaI-like protein
MIVASAAEVCFFLLPAVEELNHAGSLTMSISERVSDSFAKQQFMATLGASLLLATTGAVEITIPFRADLTQQNEFLHAGVITSILDSACGYAALTVAPENADVLSVEFKVNLLSPAVERNSSPELK